MRLLERLASSIEHKVPLGGALGVSLLVSGVALAALLSAKLGAPQDIAGEIALGAITLLAVISLVVLVSWRRLSSSLLDSEDTLRAFSRGSYKQRVRSEAPRDLRSLPQTVNSLGDVLERRIRDLLRQSEHHQAMLANMKGGLLVLDAAGRVAFVNRAAALLLDTHVETVINQDLRVSGEIGALLAETRKTAVVVERPASSSHAGQRWLGASITDLATFQNRPAQRIVELSDLTDMKRFEQTREDFVANVSHELKTPITSIQGYLETLLDGGEHSPENRDRFLHIAAKQAERLATIIDQLLSLARLESEHALDPSSFSDAPMSDLLSSVRDACALPAREKRIEIKLDSEPGLSWKLDRWLIEQALINLVHNSVKYGNPGSIVRVVARRDGQSIVINVIDESAGIGAEHLPRLFERFYRIDKARTRRFGGSGLGLAIVKHIAAAHGGTVVVESEPGRGSNFALTLPGAPGAAISPIATASAWTTAIRANGGGV